MGKGAPKLHRFAAKTVRKRMSFWWKRFRFAPVREVRPESWARCTETAPVWGKSGAETDEF